MENDAAREVEGYMNGDRSVGGRVRVAIWEKLTRAPPVIW